MYSVYQFRSSVKRPIQLDQYFLQYLLVLIMFLHNLLHRSAKKAPNNNKPSSDSKQKQDSDSKKVVMYESDAFDYSIIEESDGNLSAILTPEEWRHITATGSFKGYSHERVYFSFLKGIPLQLRMNVWLMLSRVEPEDPKYSLEVYEKLAKFSPKEIELRQIQVDLLRSFNGNQEYRYTTPLLKKILIASSGLGISYTQGMNYILLNLLISCLNSRYPEAPLGEQSLKLVTHEFERDVLFIFVHVIDELNKVFGQDLRKIFDVMKELEEEMMEMCPEVTYHMAKMGLDCMLLFSQNYFSLMMYSSPPHSLARQLLDLFLLQGYKAIHALLIRMIVLCTKQIMGTQDPVQLQIFVKSQMFKICAQRLLNEQEKAKCMADISIAFYQETKFDF